MELKTGLYVIVFLILARPTYAAMRDLIKCIRDIINNK